MSLRLVQVFGLFVKPEKVTVNGEEVSYAYDERHKVRIKRVCGVAYPVMEPGF